MLASDAGQINRGCYYKIRKYNQDTDICLFKDQVGALYMYEISLNLVTGYVGD